MKNSDLNLLAFDFWEFYLQFDSAINKIIEKHNLTRTDLTIFACCLKYFSKPKIPVTTTKIKELGIFAKTFNYPRSLKRLHRAGLLLCHPLGKKILYTVSPFGLGFHKLVAI